MAALPALTGAPPLGVVVEPEPAPEPAPAIAPCPPGMVLVHRGPHGDAFPDFCVDRFEAPNVAGAMPFAYQTAPDAEAWCKARGVELCTEDEWLIACKGASWSPYPYGSSYVRGRCADDKFWIGSPSLKKHGVTDIDWGLLARYPAPEALEAARDLYQASPSGAHAGCVSSAGAFDLVGNVAEWTRAPRSEHGYVVKGCYWAGCFGGSAPSCDFVNPAHAPGFRSYEFGFRCCAPARDDKGG